MTLTELQVRRRPRPGAPLRARGAEVLRHPAHALARARQARGRAGREALRAQQERGAGHRRAARPIVEQARRVLDEVGKIQRLARGGQDQLAGALRLGVIPTIGPYLLPDLVPILREARPDMPLMIEENLTGNLAPDAARRRARRRHHRAAVLDSRGEDAGGLRGALQRRGAERAPLGRSAGPSSPRSSPEENLLVLNNGHCFRDQVLEACPGQSNTALARRPRGQLAGDHPQHGRLGPGRERPALERAHVALRHDAR